MKKTVLYTAAAAMTAMAACSGPGQWKLSGTIEGADRQPLTIQSADNGRWYTLDTLRTDADGRFAYTHDPVGYPDVYRLVMNSTGKYVCFPIDSTEHVTINANAAAFDSDYTVAGSAGAASIMCADSIIRSAVDALGVDKALTDSLLKRQLGEIVISDPAGIASYYIICKQLGGRYLFDPSVPSDNRLVGAVANAFMQHRPDDPRTRFLGKVYLQNRAGAAPVDTFHVNELPYFDIDLMDNTGASHKLSDAVGRNKVVVLNFTAYAAEESPAFNVALAEVYDKYRSRGLEIYQVSVDDDEILWKNTARNLPWITVYNPSVSGAQLLLNYNVRAIPVTFIIADGELVERVGDISTLSAKVGAHI